MKRHQDHLKTVVVTLAISMFALSAASETIIRKSTTHFSIGGRTGPGGFASDIDDVCAVVHGPQRIPDRVGRRGIQPAVGKRVRRDIDDGHDQASGAERDLPAMRELPGHRIEGRGQFCAFHGAREFSC